MGWTAENETILVSPRETGKILESMLFAMLIEQVACFAFFRKLVCDMECVRSIDGGAGLVTEYCRLEQN